MDERHNYVKKIMELVDAGKLDPDPGALSHLHVFHNDDCAVWDGGLCDCEPEFVFEDGTRPADD